jgi:Peptidase A4 family
MKGSKLMAGFAAAAGALLCVPAVAGSASVVASAAPSIVHAARVPVAQSRLGGGVHNTWSASNWSGYAETGTYTGVSGTWTVPAVSSSSGSTYSSAWIGVDGFNDSDLIQTGTEEDYYSGSAHYDAWWEILPASETEISPSTYPVSPGDRMSASIYETSATTGGSGRHHSTEHVWDITIKDTTKGWSFSTSQGYSGPGTSAEWILEAPEVGGSIATLAHYTITPPSGLGDFDNAGILTSIVSSGTPTYTNAGLNYSNDSGVMIQKNVQVSTPGDPDSALTAFNIAYGSTLPSTPAG